MPVGLCRRQQTHDRRSALARSFEADEQPLLTAERDRPDRILDQVIVDWKGNIDSIARPQRRDV
jgi:hypothetical protein